MNDAVLIITGASSGIGAALARKLAGKVGALVLHAKSSKEALETVAAEVSGRGTKTALLLGDLGQPETAAGLVELATEQFGRLDGVVANAGFPVLKSLSEGTMEDIENAFRCNLFSFFELARAAEGHLANSPAPRIVAVGSFTSHVFRTDIRQFPISAASKGGLETAVRSLATALAEKKITVNCVVPGFIAKDAGTRDGVSESEQQQAADRIPLGRLGRPEEVAAAISFLLSEEAGYITGQALHVNGGLV